MAPKHFTVVAMDVAELDLPKMAKEQCEER